VPQGELFEGLLLRFGQVLVDERLDLLLHFRDDGSIGERDAARRATMPATMHIARYPMSAPIRIGSG
jgi:hypothetical protein